MYTENTCKRILDVYVKNPADIRRVCEMAKNSNCNVKVKLPDKVRVVIFTESNWDAYSFDTLEERLKRNFMVDVVK